MKWTIDLNIKLEFLEDDKGENGCDLMLGKES